MQSDQSNTKLTAVSVKLDGFTLAEVDRIAAAGGMKRATVVAALVSELAPRVESIQPRTGVEIKMKAGRPPASPNGTTPTLKPGRGTPFDQIVGAQ